MLKKFIIGNVVAAVIATGGLAGYAYAQSAQTDTPAAQATETAPQIDIVKAIEIAKAEVPGTVMEAELDDKHDKLVYEVEIETEDGKEMEVEIDAASGEVLEVEEDDNDRGDRGDRKGKKGKKGKKDGKRGDRS